MENPDVERSATGTRKKPTFRLVGHLVLAMKRFQAALNPTYDYGANKRSRSPSPAVNGLSKGRSVSSRTTSGSVLKSLSGRPENAGKQHGFKGNLLFKPLPPLPSEQEGNA